MNSLALVGWVLVVLVKGTTPPVGAVVEGFATKQACEVELEHYCNDRRFHCACRLQQREDP